MREPTTPEIPVTTVRLIVEHRGRVYEKSWKEYDGRYSYAEHMINPAVLNECAASIGAQIRQDDDAAPQQPWDAPSAASMTGRDPYPLWL